MEINLLDGYKSATELTQQLITLSTGIIALSITFTKDVLADYNKRITTLLKLSWLAYLLSICFGIWALMALTGLIFEAAKLGVTDELKQNPHGSSTLPSLFQILSFISGTVLIILYGIRSLKSKYSKPSENSSITPSKTSEESPGFQTSAESADTTQAGDI